MRRPIDNQRDGPAEASVPNGQAIQAMFVSDDRMFLVTEDAIYRAMFADEIDPQRVNPAIPQIVQQEELSYGTSAPFVRSTISVSAELLRDGTHFSNDFPLKRAQRLAIETARELAAIQDEITRLTARQAVVVAELEAGRWGRALLPRTQNLKGQAEQAIVHARQAALNAIALAELFYPKARDNLQWRPTLEAALRRGLPAGDPFLESFIAIADDLEMAILHRNAAVHPDARKWVRISDYELSPDDRIIAPSVEVFSPTFPVPKTDLVRYLETRLSRLSAAYELLLAVCCDRNARQHPPFRTSVVEKAGPREDQMSRYQWQTVMEPAG